LAFVACGNDDSSAEAEKSKGADAAGKRETADTEADEAEATDAKPRVQPPSGPPPKELAIEDLEEGTGPAAKPGDELKVRFVAVDRSGKELYDSWSEKPPFSFELGTSEFGTGWDEGLTGMKAGGRRELSVPADQAYEKKRALFYVVEVLEVKPANSKDGAGQAGGASRAR
jgi:peptidylprolyl isomerase